MNDGAANAAVVLGALGVVFGDIGTSPLYALQTVFAADAPGGRRRREADVYGVISLVFWSITLIVSIKYVTFIMRADNDGEGGIMALIALVQRAPLRAPRRARSALIALGIFGAVAVLRRRDDHAGDLGALGGRGAEGRRRRASSDCVRADHARDPRPCCSRSSASAPARSAALFGPVMVALVRACSRSPAWPQVVDHPEILRGALAAPTASSSSSTTAGDRVHRARRRSCSPSPAPRRSTPTWATSAARRSAAPGSSLVFPALTLNYLGQGSLILDDPSAIDNPFFLLMPALGADARWWCWRRSRR